MFNTGMTTIEFVDYLREQACKWQMPPQYIDKLDELAANEDLSIELEKLQTELDDLKNDKDDLSEALEELINKFPDLEGNQDVVIAKAALERSGTK